MVEFLQSYGIWIFFGLLFLLMMRSHGRGGMGCGMGGHRGHDGENQELEVSQGSDGDSRGTLLGR